MTSTEPTAEPTPAAAGRLGEDPPPSADGSVTFTAEQWRALQRRLGRTPYTGAMMTRPDQVAGPETLLKWFSQAIERLNEAAERAAVTDARLAEAQRIIDGGRLWHAAMAQAPGTPVKARGEAQS